MSNQPAAPEPALIAAARLGDRAAFSDLVLRWRGPLVALLCRLYGDPYLAEDAAQEAFIRAWQRLDSYQPERPFKNWLYRIGLNAALDLLRRQRPTQALDEQPLPDQAGGPEASLERKERSLEVRSAVLALPPAARTVLVLREYSGLSYQEISEVLEIPTGTVMSRLNYARTALRRSLAHCLEEA